MAAALLATHFHTGLADAVEIIAINFVLELLIR